MKCFRCGREITVHITRSAHSGYWSLDFCEHCSAAQASDCHDTCRCGVSFSAFLETGLLGCENCYDVFSERLDALLVQYRGCATAQHEQVFEPKFGRIASVRTDELRDLLLIDDPLLDEKDFLSPEAIHKIDKIQNHTEKKIPRQKVRSLRIRMARNFSKIPYLQRMNHAQKQILSSVLLSEKNVFSRWLFSKDVQIERTVYTGDEDHLRVQWITSYPEDHKKLYGVLDDILTEINEIDRLYSWQFHKKYGYLTSCPGNSGTGIRISFKVDIGKLKEIGSWSLWKRNLKSSGLVVRGSKGEGSKETRIAEISSINSWNFNLQEEFLKTSAMIERLNLAAEN
ncbi:MAG: hypothetical protein OEZ34_07630 [Spirochaetia bacterium]|nr:hypothetical protein [Spirochaetia bacterium]